MKKVIVISTKSVITSLVVYVILTATSIQCSKQQPAMSERERKELRDEAVDMFHHGFDAYMQLAWPADELMPLSCKGRYRGREIGRGDIDDALGNFSLTLIDSLDMLVVLGELDLFEQSVIKVCESVTFDTDVVVSVFETNIRVVGGLLSGHVLSTYLKERYDRMWWYNGQLLDLALDVANRLLPAFNSTTGLPYPRVNLKSGLQGVESQQLTCTACAGSIILEFAALSRLSGEPIYEEVATKAMDYLWSVRHRQSNLVGNVLNVNTGDWVRREAGIGAGIDSYYEYVAKAYILLGEEKYLDRWNIHYSAIMKYLATGPLMPDVHMHRPTTSSKHFTDALTAFWPGLQVLMGDLKPAIEQHEVLYQIIQKHNFLPEAVTQDFQVYWGQHFLRPEFLESTYFLYKATKDPHYLQVGKQVLRALQKYARVTCGYAAVKDVRMMSQEDRMDSFVLTETFKYLYLLFSRDEELFLDMDRFVFTTEAHLLPVSLQSSMYNTTKKSNQNKIWNILDQEVDSDRSEFSQSCPTNRFLFPDHQDSVEGVASIREPLNNLVTSSSPKLKTISRTLLAADFTSSNPQHLKIVKDMGINIISLPDGRTQLLHTLTAAKSRHLGEEGLLFMQEMIEIARHNTTPESPPKQVSFTDLDGASVVLQAGPAQFGPTLGGQVRVSGEIVIANDIKACANSQQNGESMKDKIVLVERGECMFIEKAKLIESMGARGGIVMDTTPGSAAASSPLFAMSGDGSQDVNIPMVFLFRTEADQLMAAMIENNKLVVTLEEKPSYLQSDDQDQELLQTVKSADHSLLAAKQSEQGVTGDVTTITNKEGSSRTIKTLHRLTAAQLEALSPSLVMKTDDKLDDVSDDKLDDVIQQSDDKLDDVIQLSNDKHDDVIQSDDKLDDVIAEIEESMGDDIVEILNEN